MTYVKNYSSRFLFFIVFVTFLVAPFVHALEGLNITVNTSDYTYWVTNYVDIYGDLTSGGQPVDGLVGLEVKDPSGDIMVIRTLQTGTNPPTYNITFLAVEPRGSPLGPPKYQFAKGSVAYFWVVLNNTGPEAKSVLVTLSVYDAANVPLVYTLFQMTFLGPYAFSMSVVIPTWASTGTAKVYADVYTDWPSAGGTPLCPEESVSITIYESGGGGGFSIGAQAPSVSASSTGSYSLSFKSSIMMEAGLYTVYVASSYQGEQATEATTFLVNIPDATGDGYVNLDDLEALSWSWLSESGQPKYNPDADFNEDGLINLDDLEILSMAWLYEPPP